MAAGLIVVLGIAIFKKRKAEICGFIGMNKYLNTVTVFVASFFAFCFAINLLPLSGLENSMIAAVIFAALYIGLELLILRDTRKFKKGLLKLPAELVLCGIAVSVFATGLFGYSERIPEKEDIKEVMVL